MKKLVILAVFLIAGCTSSSPAPSMNPLQAAGCDVEQVITGAFGNVIVNQCAGTDAVACGGALQVALGNVNVCAAPIPQPAGMAAMSVPKWHKVGDVTKGDLDAGKQSLKAQDVAPQGIVGAVVCPIAFNAIMGLATGVVPKECGCTKNLDAGGLGAALIAACIAAVPI